MFDFVANHKRLIQIVLFLIIVPPFAMFGIAQYRSAESVDSGNVAKVAGIQISQKDFSDAMQRQQDRMKAMLGNNVDAAQLDTPEVRQSVLDTLIAQRLLAQFTVRGNFNVSNNRIAEVTASIPAFQDNGKFSPERYDAALRQQGLTHASFDNSLRSDLMAQQVASALTDSGIVSNTVAARISKARAEQRDVSQVTVAGSDFQSQVKPTAAEIQAYYDTHKTEFAVPEQVKPQFVVLSADKMVQNAPVPADQVKKLYDDNKSHFTVPEERQASHILVAFKEGASEADKQAARDKAAKLLAQVKQSPASFADLAKKNSDDTGSAIKGGDLGYFGRGMMVKPFEDGVYSMQLNEIRSVESQYGVHIIKLTGIHPATVKPFEEMRPQIEAQLRNQDAAQRFAKAADGFSNTVYDQADSLKPAADQFGLTVQTADWTTRQSSPEKQLNNPKLLAALFSDDVIKNKHNTEVVEIAPGTLVAARVGDYRPAAQKTLDQVKDEVTKQLIASNAATLAQKDGAAKLDELKKGGAVPQLKFAAAKTITHDNPQGLDGNSLEAVRANVSKLPAYVGVTTATGYNIYRIDKVSEGSEPADQAKNIQTELGRIAGAQEFRAFLDGLRKEAKVDINADALSGKTQTQTQ